MKKAVLLGILFAVMTAGCSREPMIQINEDVRASLDAKVALSKQLEEGNESETPLAKGHFLRMADNMMFDWGIFVPTHNNQLKVFTNGTTRYSTYMEYSDENVRRFQMSEQFDSGEMHMKVFEQTDEQLIQLSSYENVLHCHNVLKETALSSVSEPRILLQAPLAVGTTWVAYRDIESTITALYESVELHGTKYENVIEVTTHLDGYELEEYYAANEGLILTEIIDPSTNTVKESWQLLENYPDSALSMNIEITVPVSEQEIIKREKATLTLFKQTNETCEMMFERLFIEQGWIPNDIHINYIKIDANGVASIDFTPGVVAGMNAHPTKEEGVLPAIVQSVARYFQTKQVRLSVGGYNLLPDRLPSPAGGLWEVVD